MAPTLSVVLVRPQLGQNIGLAARAMGNFGVSDLRLVSPRDPWPNPEAQNASVAAKPIIEGATLYDSLAEATKDLSWVFCTSARLRYIKKEVYTLSQGTNLVKTLGLPKIGLVFGPEQAGLTNEEVSLCHGGLLIKTSSTVPSLNLAHAVLLCLYEFSRVSYPTPLYDLSTHGNTLSFLCFFEERLEKKGFFSPKEKEEKMRQNLRDIFLRRPLSYQDINTLFGAIKALEKNVDNSSKR